MAIAEHAPSGEPARIRAWDLRNNRPLWKARHGQKWVATDDDEIYELPSIDTTSGRRLWTHRLSAEWIDHRFLGGHRRRPYLRRRGVLSAADGQRIAGLAS